MYSRYKSSLKVYINQNPFKISIFWITLKFPNSTFSGSTSVELVRFYCKYILNPILNITRNKIKPQIHCKGKIGIKLRVCNYASTWISGFLQVFLPQTQLESLKKAQTNEPCFSETESKQVIDFSVFQSCSLVLNPHTLSASLICSA